MEIFWLVLVYVFLVVIGFVLLFKETSKAKKSYDDYETSIVEDIHNIKSIEDCDNILNAIISANKKTTFRCYHLEFLKLFYFVKGIKYMLKKENHNVGN